MKPSPQPLNRRLGLLALAFGLAQGSAAANLSQQQLTGFANEAKVGFGVITNFAAKPQAQMTINNASSVALPAGTGEWRIYFHSVRKLDSTQVAGLSLRHVQGDLHELAPTAAFKGLATGASVNVPYASSAHLVSYTDFMPRAFIAQPGLKAEIFANTDTENLKNFVAPFSKPEQQLRASNDRYAVATAESRYEENLAVNQAASAVDPTPKIVPTPFN
ncbi:MAG TPA: carbohydate-binding domain-containing protein, partial [Cellvibrio sp.]|nr:carbohydate-binding domain-containing protein [Cellvibrio sp.]